MRAAGLAQETLRGVSCVPPAPPMFSRWVSLKRTTASSELPPRTLAIVHGGRIVVGQPGGKLKLVQAAVAQDAASAAAASSARNDDAMKRGEQYDRQVRVCDEMRSERAAHAGRESV